MRRVYNCKIYDPFFYQMSASFHSVDWYLALPCLGIIFILVIAVFVIGKITKANREIHNIRSMSMWKKPNRPTTIWLTLHQYRVGFNTFKYFLKINGPYCYLGSIRAALLNQGFVTPAIVSGITYNGLVFSTGIIHEPNGFASILVHPILFHMLQTRVLIKSGSDEIRMINSRIEVSNITRDSVLILRSRSNL